MVSLDSVLRTGVSGLTANQVALNTTSNNIANVNTDGYVRRQAGFESRVLGGTPVGVNATAAIRAINQFLVKEERTIFAQEKRFEAMQVLHEQMQTLLGSPGDDLTFTGQLDRAFQQISFLATDPNGSVPRVTTVEQFQSFANEMNRVSKLLLDLREDADVRIQQSLIKMNNEIDFVDSINPKIVRGLSLGDDVTTLEEQRAQRILALSEFADIGTFNMEGGALGISSGNGQVLLDQIKRELNYESPGTVTTGTEFQQIKIQKVNPDGSKQDVDVLDPFLISGSLFGLLEMRDVQIPNMMVALGELSAKVIDQFNLVHNDHSPVPPPALFSGRNVGVLSTDNHNFTGKVTLATVNASNVLVNRVVIDFTAGTVTPNGGAAAAIGGNTIGHVITAVNTGFGAVALSLTAGALSFQAATGVGVAILQDDTSPSDRAGRGFAHYFGFNDFLQAEAPAHFDTGFATSDAHGFGASGAVTLDLVGPRGQISKSFRLDFAAAGATTFADVINVLNTGFAGVASFSMSSTGKIISTPAAAFADHHFSTTADTTTRGTTAKTFSEIFGIARSSRIDQAFKVTVRSDILSDSKQLALAQLDLGAAAIAGTTSALTVGDNRGVIALQNVANTSTIFSAAGDITDTTKTLAEYAALVLADFALKADDVENRYEDSSALKAEISARVKNDSGVNLDEELANMILFQNAFNASARIVAATRDMFDELLSIAR